MASITKTSLSGSDNFTWSLQSWPRSSTHWLPFHLTIKLRPRRRRALEVGERPGWRATQNGDSKVDVQLGDDGGLVAACGSQQRRPGAPSGVTASARGVSVNSVTMFSGVPPSVEPSLMRVEDPDVGAADAGGGQLRIVRMVLAAMRRGDEGAVLARAGEHDVARLVADQQGAHHPPARTAVVDVDDADAVREVVDDPDLVVGPRRDRDRLQPDRHRGAMPQPMSAHGEDLESVVGRIHGKEQLAAGRQRQRPDLSALEDRRRRAGHCGRNRQHHGKGQQHHGENSGSDQLQCIGRKRLRIALLLAQRWRCSRTSCEHSVPPYEMVTFLGSLPARRGKIDASRQDFRCGLCSQEVAERMRDSQGLPALRQKVTGGAPPWGAGRGRPGQQAGATPVAGATNVAPSQT